jgi:ankyrin repeat protein
MRLRTWCALACLAVLFSCSVPGPATRKEAAGAAATAPEGAPARASKAVTVRGNPRPLFEAAAKGDLAEARSLVEKNPSLTAAVDAQGWNALDYASWAGRKEVYDYLASRGAAPSLFAEAALGPFPALVERLKARPADVRERDLRERATPLVWAARSGNLESCHFLLSRGAEADAADRSGQTALAYAADQGNAELGRELLRAGANPNKADAKGVTPLHRACASGSFEMVEQLLDSGASLAAVDQEGNTPLHAAAAAGRLEICEYLLFRGADKTAKNKQGLTAGDLAARSGNMQLAKMLNEGS